MNVAMPDIRKICLIDTMRPLTDGFRQLGYTVLHVSTGTDLFFDLESHLAEHDFAPDLVIQAESLSSRTVVTGLSGLDCPTLFWAVDPHLNADWHDAYARLFDVTCSTQKAWIPRLKRRGAVDIQWLPMFGHEAPWTDMGERKYDVAFVGRISDQRPARKWMVEYLADKGRGFDMAIEGNLSYADMLALYRDSRIIPNESILGEVNFRLFEGASSGCLVLSQDLGEEQELLFERGREFDTYDHIGEMDAKLAKYLSNPRMVQAMGMAARERVLAEHLPVHRARQMVDYAMDAARNRATGGEADKWMALSIAGLWESEKFSLPVGEVLKRLGSLPSDEDVAEAVLRVQAAAGMQKYMADNAQTLLGARLYESSFEVNLTGSMACLRLDNWDGAKGFWYRHQQTSGARESVPPTDPTALLTLWAKELKRRNRIVRAGFPYTPSKHLPFAASECFIAILADQPEHLPTLRLLDTVLRPIMGLEQARVGYLSILTLHERSDWRLALEIALANLKSYRLESGLEELRLARELAKKVGQEAMFTRALASLDKSGLLAERLGG